VHDVTALLTELFALPRTCLSAALVAERTKSLTAARLRWLSRPKLGNPSGIFRFPFGRVHYTDALALETMFEELFLSRVYAVRKLPDRPYIVDCGGNIGLSVIWFKQRYPQARITVFEADPTLAEILAENVHHLGLTSIEVVKAAVSGTAGPIKFAHDRPLTGHVTSGEGLPIHCVKLSDRLEEPVDLLKVDIEGSEFSLLGDLCATGKIKLVRHLVCEVHCSTQVQQQVHALWTALCRAGFALTIAGAVTNGRLPGPPDPTPFAGVASGKYIMWLYAWQP
jgi:FkbM family methyltransferase